MSVRSEELRRSSPLPRVLTPLLGRVRESDQLRAMLRDAAHRLVTVTGPGGVGKTRLTLHVASSLIDDFDDDVVFVPLAAIREPELVLPAIGEALGVFSDARDAYADTLVEHLRGQQVLLVLDNFEQVLDAAPALAHILAHCPDLTMLVTSQAALGVAGEQLYPLEPLAVPAATETVAETIARTDAVALFVQRARAVSPHLVIDDRTAAAIAEICRRLDGLPLAIELAAARVTILSPEALLARLSNRLQVLSGDRRDVPDRLRTMRNAVAWSYELLQPAEQALFRRLAVFRGGVSLEAVEAVFPPGRDGRDAVDVLSTLVDHSLVKSTPLPSGEARFLMLETLRDYGLEQLDLLGEADDAHLAHATFFVDLAEVAQSHLEGHEQAAWLERLDPEIENIRAAIDWALAHGRPEIPLRIGGATWRFWSLRGRLTESRAWMERALADDDGTPSEARVKALIGAGHIMEDQRDLDAAHERFEQAWQVAEALGSAWHASTALHGLGIVAHDRGEYGAAMEHHTRAAELARQAGNRRALASTLGSMGAVSYYRGNLEDAERFWNEGRQIVIAMGDIVTEALVTSNLGAVAAERGDYASAERLQQRALALQRQMNLQRDLPYTLINLGEIARVLGDYTLSHDCYAEAILMLREQGSGGIEGVALHGFAELLLAQQDISGAASQIIEGTRLVAEANDRLSVVEYAELLAKVCEVRGDFNAAVELMGATSAAREALGSQPNPVKQTEREKIETDARTALHAATYAAQWEAGRTLDPEQLARRIT
ncbi:MAG TPA: tetratricopeptide repeat protein, partial [Thermomicrobiales bacterium]|nr:tetratricopeptide repeat protein [Thermomicrobiales bacterium]